MRVKRFHFLLFELPVICCFFVDDCILTSKANTMCVWCERLETFTRRLGNLCKRKMKMRKKLNYRGEEERKNKTDMKWVENQRDTDKERNEKIPLNWVNELAIYLSPITDRIEFTFTCLSKTKSSRWEREDSVINWAWDKLPRQKQLTCWCVLWNTWITRTGIHWHVFLFFLFPSLTCFLQCCSLS